MWKKFCKLKIVRFFASLQLAVLVIVSMTALMIWGTLTESRYGSEFARWHVYLSPIFLLTETLLFLNILFAALVRIPFKKRLTGFYITHLGLLLILLGAGITAVKGIDGSLELVPGKANRNVLVNVPHFYGVYHDNQGEKARQIREALPRVAKEIQGTHKLFQKLGDYEIFLERYIPFASPKMQWRPNPEGHPKTQAIWAELKNDQVQQTLTLSNLSQEDSLQSLGPLSLGLLNNISGKCFHNAISDDSNKFLLQIKDQCVILKDIPQNGFRGDGFSIRLAKSHPFKKIILDYQEQTHNFYPQLSVFPVNKQVRILKDSQLNLMELELWRKSPQVIFFKENILAFGKGRDWEITQWALHQLYPLPWMGFTLTVTRNLKNRQPFTEWVYHPPKAGSEKRNRAALIRLVNKKEPELNKTLWVDDREPVGIQTGKGESLQFLLGAKVIQLPFEIELDNFKMATNPGTMDPASYESFVKVNAEDSSTQAHVFMNNPLKKAGFTFYQASYFQLENGQGYGSIFSVNQDPGRLIKYMGSFLLVSGATTHFAIRSRRKKRTAS